MATKSFLKNIVITDRKKASAFVSALENAENKGRKKVDVNVPIRTRTDKETIKKMFGAN